LTKTKIKRRSQVVENALRFITGFFQQLKKICYSFNSGSSVGGELNRKIVTDQGQIAYTTVPLSFEYATNETKLLGESFGNEEEIAEKIGDVNTRFSRAPRKKIIKKESKEDSKNKEKNKQQSNDNRSDRRRDNSSNDNRNERKKETFNNYDYQGYRNNGSKEDYDPAWSGPMRNNSSNVDQTLEDGEWRNNDADSRNIPRPNINLNRKRTTSRRGSMAPIPQFQWGFGGKPVIPDKNQRSSDEQLKDGFDKLAIKQMANKINQSNSMTINSSTSSSSSTSQGNSSPDLDPNGDVQASKNKLKQIMTSPLVLKSKEKNNTNDNGNSNNPKQPMSNLGGSINSLFGGS